MKASLERIGDFAFRGADQWCQIYQGFRDDVAYPLRLRVVNSKTLDDKPEVTFYFDLFLNFEWTIIYSAVIPTPEDCPEDLRQLPGWAKMEAVAIAFLSSEWQIQSDHPPRLRRPGQFERGPFKIYAKRQA